METLTLFAGGGALSLLIKWGYAVWRRRNGFDETLQTIHTVYNHLSKIMSITGANRVMICAAHNGGGVPRIGCVCKSSLVYEVFDGPLKGMRTGWQDVILDKCLFTTLREVASRVPVIKRRENMPPSSILGTLFTAQGVTEAHTYWVGNEQKRWYYLDMHFTKDVELSPAQREALRGHITALQQIFKKEVRR